MAKKLKIGNKYTEKESNHSNLEQKTTEELLYGMNQEDQLIADAVKQIIPKLIPLVDTIVGRLQKGARLFYLGAGTSGRLGILDASECPPTFGVPAELVTGLIAGGDSAIRKAVEHAEDNTTQGWNDLQQEGIETGDVVIGIAASGTTPYVVGALKQAQENQVTTACITCNEDAPIAGVSDFPIEVIVGPEYVTGSTRMKSGTAQKLILNMISTSTMIKLGRVKGNRMVDMQLSNQKLVERGSKMIMQALDIPYEQAKEKLLNHGSVRKAIEANNRKMEANNN